MTSGGEDEKEASTEIRVISRGKVHSEISYTYLPAFFTHWFLCVWTRKTRNIDERDISYAWRQDPSERVCTTSRFGQKWKGNPELNAAGNFPKKARGVRRRTHFSDSPDRGESEVRPSPEGDRWYRPMRASPAPSGPTTRSMRTSFTVFGTRYDRVRLPGAKNKNAACKPWAWAPRPLARDPRFPDRS